MSIAQLGLGVGQLPLLPVPLVHTTTPHPRQSLPKGSCALKSMVVSQRSKAASTRAK